MMNDHVLADSSRNRARVPSGPAPDADRGSVLILVLVLIVIGSLVVATIGAVIFLFVVRLIKKA